MAVEEKKKKLTKSGKESANCKRITTAKAPYDEKYKSGLPPYITVDELRMYRRRPVNTWPKDNLRLEKGEFKSIKSEYKRRFKNFWDAINRSLKEEKNILKVHPIKSESLLRLEGSHDVQSEYKESFTKHFMESLTQQPSSQIMDNATPASKLQIVEGTTVRPPLIKKSTNLKLEGDYLHVTEYAEKFIELILSRSALLRTPTTLKLEGEMETKTENREKFIKYDEFQRPALCKKLSNLHLEGDYEILTESHEKFPPYEVSRRPPLTKKSTNLHLEGDLSLVPEYRSQFVDYKAIDRPKLAIPVNNLKDGGIVDNQTKEVNSFDRKMHPLIPFLREPDSRSHDFITSRRTSARDFYEKSGKSFLDNYDTSKSASHPNLTYTTQRGTGNVMGSETKPEYRSSYIDFYKQGRISPTVKMARQSELSYMKGDNKMDMQPEYSSSYVNFPRRRPRVPKPEPNLSSEGEIYHVTEKSEKYYPHTHIQKTETCKREPELKLEGRFECQPEYRKAYIDYLIRERKPTAVQRRAFALVDTNESSDLPKDESSEPESIQKNEGNTLQVPNKSNLTISPKSKDSSSYTSSICSSPKLQSSAQRYRKLSNLETTAFGPKFSSSRELATPCPIVRHERENKLEVIRDYSPTATKQMSSGLHKPIHIHLAEEVENNKWSDSTESDAAFQVLDERLPSKRISTSNLYKEQKWMPSWKY